MARKWHNTGFAWDEQIILGDELLVQLYRKQINKLKQALTHIYKEYETLGVVDYKSMQRTDKLDTILQRLHGELKDTFRMRATIVKNDIKRASAAKYDDVLYTLEKIVSTRIGNRGTVRKKVPHDTILERVYGTKKPKLEDRFNSLNKRTSQEMETVIRAGIKENLALSDISKRVTGMIERDLGRVVQVNHLYSNTAVNAAVDIAIQSYPEKITNQLLDEAGKDGLVKVWLHDDPKTARQGHILMHGTLADADGMFENPLTGKKAPYPGGFGSEAEDSGCCCSITVMTRADYESMKATFESERNSKLAKYGF